MFSSMDALEIGKRNSIQRALNDYFTAWYLFSVKQLNVSNHFLSLSHFTLSFISFRSFHRISVLVKLSGPFQLRPTYMGVKQPFSQNLGLRCSIVLKESFPSLMFCNSLFVSPLYFNKVTSWK